MPILSCCCNFISIIINSDAFQARLAARKEVVVDPVVVATLEQRFKALATKSAENVMKKLEANELDGKFALEVLKESGKLAGYGASDRGGGATIQTNFVVALPGPAASAQVWAERFAVQGAEVVTPRMDDAPSE